VTAVSASPPVREPLDRTLLSIVAVIVLDTTVVNVAINTLSSDFHTSLATIQWIAIGYTLALATVLLPRSRPEAPVVEEDEDVPATPVLMHA